MVGYGVSFLARRRQRRLQRQLDALDAEKGELEKRLASANEQAELLLAQGARSGFQEAAAMSKSVAEATAAAKRVPALPRRPRRPATAALRPVPGLPHRSMQSPRQPAATAAPVQGRFSLP